MTKIDIEKLLQWAYREELSKRATSSAEGIWGRIREIGQRGGIDVGHGAAQRYPHFGLPHRDAEAIELAVALLPNAEIDWREEADQILGDLTALADPRPTVIERGRAATAGWTGPGGKQRVRLEPPRTVLLVRTLSTSALITMHAKMGTRPNWRSDCPQAGPTPATKGPNAMVIGECRGKNLYSFGSHCPVRWSPSPITVAEARADYLAWWRGMALLVSGLELESWQPTLPAAPEMPWIQAEILAMVHSRHDPNLRGLPLKPARPVLNAAPRRKRDPGRLLTLGANR